MTGLLRPGDSSRNRSALLGTLAVTCALALVGSLFVGSVALGPAQVFAALGGHGSPLAHTLVLDLRLPRSLAAFATGALLGLAGALMQVLLRNPLADPYVL
ncbi:MAG: iron chelate uptake ABC transporter family permease subunit, partial [Gammaproteobacteria bacterium]